MDVETLLTRQMELHTSVRQPPKNPHDLVQLVDMMRNFRRFFESLRKLAERFQVEPETVFQAFMHISIGGTVNFDRQHQDGAVPMHQAKVLARSNAIELAPKLQKTVPSPELMVYVGLSRDLRNTLRVKVEDGNDLKTAEKSVCEAVEYLNYIQHRAQRSPEKLYALYMAEDPRSLAALLGDETSPLTTTPTSTLGDTFSATNPLLALPSINEDGTPSDMELSPLPSPLSGFLPHLKKRCAAASDASLASGSATRRLKAAQVILHWVTTVPTEFFAEHAEEIVATTAPTLALLASEKRSALCRAGCDVIIMMMQRLSPEPIFLADVRRWTCSTNPATFSGALSLWVSSLAKGIFVTVAAISSATDAALRVIAIQSHGHLCVMKTLLLALSRGSQTELRRKCLGYLALCAAAAHEAQPDRLRDIINLVGPVSLNYLSIGDSPSRKMARSLCSVLRVLASASRFPAADAVLHISDAHVEQLLQQERPRVEEAVRGGPLQLEELLFEVEEFASSIRSTFSSTSQRTLRGSGRGLGRGGMNSVADRRGSRPRDEAGQVVPRGARGSAPSFRDTDAASEADVPQRQSSEIAVFVPQHTLRRSPVRRDPVVVPAGKKHDTGDALSTKSHAGHVSPETSSQKEKPSRCSLVQENPSPAKSAGTRLGTTDASRVLTPTLSESNEQPGDIYDEEVFLDGSDAVPGAEAAVQVCKGSISQSHISPSQRASAPLPSRRGGSFGSKSSITLETEARTAVALPSIATAPRRTSQLHHSNAEAAAASHQRNSTPSTDRLIPLSLRGGDTPPTDTLHHDRLSPTHTTGVTTTASASAAARISVSLRRKIEERKGALGP